MFAVDDFSKTTIVGLSIIFISSVFITIMTIVNQSIDHAYQLLALEPLKEVVPFYIFGFGAALFMMIGFATYQANFIQLGLDQLLDSPSISLSLFVHWAVWADTLGTAVTAINSALLSCPHTIIFTFVTILVVIFLCFPLLMILTCWKRCWFYAEPGQNNPYKTVFKVFNFVRKHKYPLQRSAFTYCDDELPSRIDYAKERYGGPFTTCLLYTSPSPRDATLSRMPSSA